MYFQEVCFSGHGGFLVCFSSNLPASRASTWPPAGHAAAGAAVCCEQAWQGLQRVGGGGLAPGAVRYAAGRAETAGRTCSRFGIQLIVENS